MRTRDPLAAALALLLAGCASAKHDDREAVADASPAADIPAVAPERAVTYDEGADFLQRLYDSAYVGRILPKPVPSYPFDKTRGAVVASRGYFAEPPIAPRLVPFHEAGSLLDDLCHFGLAELPPTRCEQGACLVLRGDACWYALRRRGGDFFIAGFIMAIDDEPEAEPALRLWLDEVRRQFGPVE